MGVELWGREVRREQARCGGEVEIEIEVEVDDEVQFDESQKVPGGRR